MRDMPGHVINYSGANTLDIELGGPSSSANCRAPLQGGTVAKNVLFVRKMIASANCRLELDSDSCGGNSFVHEATQGRVRLRRKLPGCKRGETSSSLCGTSTAGRSDHEAKKKNSISVCGACHL